MVQKQLPGVEELLIDGVLSVPPNGVSIVKIYGYSRYFFTSGEWVWYFTTRKYTGCSPKWQDFIHGPLTVQESRGPVNYLVQRSWKAKPFLVYVDKLRSCNDRPKEKWKETAVQSETEIRRKAMDIPADSTVRERLRRAVKVPTRYPS